MIDIRRLFLIAVCLFSLLSLGACSAGQIYSPDEIHRDVSFVSGGVTVVGTLNYIKGKDMTFTVKEPENISGTVFTSQDISFSEIKINYGKMKNNSPVNILFEILTDFLGKAAEIPLKGEYSYSGAISSAGYKIIIDCENSEIKSIETEKFIYSFE